MSPRLRLTARASCRLLLHPVISYNTAQTQASFVPFFKFSFVKLEHFAKKPLSSKQNKTYVKSYFMCFDTRQVVLEKKNGLCVSRIVVWTTCGSIDQFLVCDLWFVFVTADTIGPSCD